MVTIDANGNLAAAPVPAPAPAPAPVTSVGVKAAQPGQVLMVTVDSNGNLATAPVPALAVQGAAGPGADGHRRLERQSRDRAGSGLPLSARGGRAAADGGGGEADRAADRAADSQEEVNQGVLRA